MHAQCFWAPAEWPPSETIQTRLSTSSCSVSSDWTQSSFSPANVDKTANYP